MRPIGADVRRLLAWSCAAALLLVGFLAGPVSAAPGDLDPSFDGDGKLITDAGAGSLYDRASGVAVQPDGKLVAVGETEPIPGGLVRYNADGSLDQSFGVGGRVEAVISPREVALQPDGKIVLAGRVFHAGNSVSGDFAVARYNSDGTLDTGFGSGGRTVTQFPPPGDFATLKAVANRVLILPDGKILAAGITAATRASGTVTATSALALARYNSDGTLDTGFGSGGKQAVPASRTAYTPDKNGLARQGDGKIVLATTSSDGDLFLVRLTSDGKFLDLGFNGSGIVRTNLFTSEAGESFDSANDVAIQGGKILAAGATRGPGTAGSDFALVRYNLDGSLDRSFDGDGKLVTDFGAPDASDPTPDDAINRLAITGDGKILAAGCASSTGNCGAGGGDFGLSAYHPNGTPDTTFGTAGRVTTAFGPGLDAANDIAIQPADGKLVAAGQAFNGTDDDFALTRYLAPLPAPVSVPAPAIAGPTPTPVPSADTTRPIISSLRLSPTRFRAARSGPSISARVGARVSYRLSEAASARFRVQRAFPGRRVGASCVRPRRSNRSRRRCTRYLTMRGSFTHRGKAGANRFRFRGRLRARKLRPGRYRLRAVASDQAKNSSVPRRKGFRIVRR